MSHETAISDFIDKNKLGVNKYADLPPFKCGINYKSRIGNPSAEANVRISIHGMEYGDIDIE